MTTTNRYIIDEQAYNNQADFTFFNLISNGIIWSFQKITCHAAGAF